MTRFRSDGPRLKSIGYRDIFALNMDAGLAGRILPRLFFAGKKPIFSGGLEVLLKRGFKVNGIFTTKNLEKYVRTQVFPENDFDAVGGAALHRGDATQSFAQSDLWTVRRKHQDQEPAQGQLRQSERSSGGVDFLAWRVRTFRNQTPKGVDMYFFDGEIRDTLSTHVAADQGADLVISSYSIQPYHYSPEIGSLHEYGIPIIFNQAIYQLIQQKIERHVRHQNDVRAMINAVQGYMREAQIDEKHIEKLTEILINRTRFNPSVDYIYIHPSPQDFEFFFAIILV